MLNCCKSDQIKRVPKLNSVQSPKSQFKYSFKQNAAIYVGEDRSLSRSKNQQIRNGNEYNRQSQMANIEAQLNAEYDELIKQQKRLNEYMLSMRPLQNDVAFYQRQVREREKQLQQLHRLLDYVMHNRAHNRVIRY